MSNLTSSVPGAFTAFYDLLVTAGSSQNPKVSVFAQALGSDEPDSYVLLGGCPDPTLPGIRNHELEPASLGSLNQWETYEIWGYASVFDGNFDPTTTTVLTDTWTLFQDVVMSTFVSYDGGNGSIGGVGSPILNWTPPAGVTLERMLPIHADYTGAQVQGGFAGVVEFGFSFKARLTVS